MRRFAMIALSFILLLGFSAAHHLPAQDASKKEEPSKPEASQPGPAKGQDQETAKAKGDTPKPDASASAEATPPPIPPEVEAKLEAARRAVAEAIVAAQDAGLVKTTIDPPPILDILINGRADDEITLKARTGVSPEVFGAWFAGYGTTKDINPEKDVRIANPAAALKEFYDKRSNLLSRHIDAVRKAQGGTKKDEATAAKGEPKEEKAKEEKAKEEGGEPKKDAVKESDASKDAKKAEPEGDSTKKDDKKNEESKDKDDTPK